jgi:hypothetical protein
MKIRFNIPEILVPLITAMLVLCLSILSGMKGLYLFDSSINYNMGWLIYKGLIPFTDFSMPLTPLTGILTAFGYWIFGVNYMSGVYIAAIMSAIGTIIIYNNLKKLLPWHINAAFSFFAVASTIPMFGILYYNHVSMLFIIIISSYLLKYICSDEDEFTPINSLKYSIVYFFIALLCLTKLHFGVVLFAIALMFDVLTAIIKKVRPEKAIAALIIRLSLAAVTAVLTLWWLRFNFVRIFYDLFKLSTPNISGQSCWLDLGIPFNIFSQPEISLFMFVTFLPGLLIYLFRPQRKSGKAFMLFLFFVSILLAQFLFTVISAEAPSISASISLLLVVVAYLIVDNAEDIRTRARGSAQNLYLFVMPMIFTIGIFALFYSGLAIRKAWDEASYMFPYTFEMDNKYFPSKMPYFKGVKMKDSQKITIDRINNEIRHNRNKKFFFGAGLEMLYAPAKSLPPRGWPLWTHEDVSVKPESYPELAKKFGKARYDIVILSKGRLWLTRFLDQQLVDNYIQMPEQEGVWVNVWRRK